MKSFEFFKLIFKDILISAFFTGILYFVLKFLNVNKEVIPYIVSITFLFLFLFSVSASFYLFKLKNKIEELNDKIVKISRFDEQTNVYKRMYLFEMADKYINTAQRKHIPMSIMLVDIDDFKFYNKRYGHEFSDKILKKIAQIIKRNTRGMDIVGRFGGDEFIIVSLGNRNELMSLANRINKEVRNLKIENMNLNISVSAGISEFQKGDKLIDVIKRAEEALFLAKEKGGARADYLEHFLLFE